uniref:O-acyltransferase n=1 Tax=Syphacia muris TaxID=451379 RepID=A0A0N5AH49_9BILA
MVTVDHNIKRRRVSSLSFGDRYSDKVRRGKLNGKDYEDRSGSDGQNTGKRLSQKSNCELCNFSDQFEMLTPVHKPQSSLFSSSSGWTNFRGLFNLAILLLFVSNGRVALENLIKYGILINPTGWIHYISSTYHHNWPNLTLTTCSNITILLAFLFEKLLAAKIIGNTFGGILYTVLLALHIILPAVFVLWGNPLFTVVALSVYVVTFLKLVSYAHVNYWSRTVAGNNVQVKKVNFTAVYFLIFYLRSAKSDETYPNNISLKNLYYFMFAPTLCYEINFPRTSRIHKRFVLKRFCEFISLSIIIVALYQQWVMPLLRNSVEPFSKMKLGRCVERVLKLAIPNHVIWLIFFYTFFHSLLNFVAELLRFADRRFYLDFWNAETLSVFWKTWNIPVHRWAVRHLYKPMINMGFGKMSAAVAVFFVSAFFHEYLVSVPLSMFRLWAFYAMISQIPLSYITDKVVHGGRTGNIIMWVTLILGQPMVILMYVHDWYIMHHPHVKL